MKFIKSYIFIFVFVLIGTACSEYQKVQKSGTFEERYNYAIKLFNEKDYYRSSLLLESLLALSVGRAESEKIDYYYAFCQYYEEQYLMSSYYFKKFTNTYSRSELTEECNYMYALSLSKMSPIESLDQTNTSEAIEAFQTFLNRYPQSNFADTSNVIVDLLHEKLERKAYNQTKLYHQLSRYKATVVAVESFRKRYPDAHYNEELAFLKVDAQYELAKISIEKVKKDGKTILLKKQRLNETITFYKAFIDKYSSSTYLKDAEQIYKNATEDLKELNNQ
ncbi:MAG: outer membrane protein assembly factor BamD [Cytophagales bacterium]|nr:outer membrane protein assembly factor BamD [Cytophagales bacterium]